MTRPEMAMTKDLLRFHYNKDEVDKETCHFTETMNRTITKVIIPGLLDFYEFSQFLDPLIHP